MKIFGIPVLVAVIFAAVGYAVAKRTEIRIPLLAP